MKKKTISLILLILLLFSGCGTNNSNVTKEPKEVDEIIHAFEYNDYTIFYSFASNIGLEFKTNGDCFSFEYNNGKYTIEKKTLPTKFLSEVSYPLIRAKILTGEETLSTLHKNEFNFSNNGYSYDGFIDGDDTNYTYVKDVYEGNECTYVSFYDSVKQENYRYIISGTPRESSFDSYGTLSKTGEENCKEFYKAYQNVLKELGLTETDLDSFYEQYYEKYIREIEEKINNNYVVKLSDEDCYKVLLSEKFSFYKHSDNDKIGENDVFVTKGSDYWLLEIKDGRVYSGAIFPYTLEKLYPDWSYIEYFDTDYSYANNSASGCIVDIKAGTQVEGTVCSSDDIETAKELKLIAPMLFSSDELSQSQILSAILYYYNN